MNKNLKFMKKIYIVNENDEIIGAKEREEVGNDEISRVSALWIENSNGEILLAQRKLTKKHSPGKWGPAVAGTVEEGETYEENVVKEAKEELGLMDFEMEKGPKIRRHTSHEYFTQWFIAKVDKDISEFKIQEDEVEQVKWMNKKELSVDSNENPENYNAGANIWIDEFCK